MNNFGTINRPPAIPQALCWNKNQESGMITPSVRRRFSSAFRSAYQILSNPFGAAVDTSFFSNRFVRSYPGRGESLKEMYSQPTTVP